MDMTYSDMYALFENDHRAQEYFNSLPGYIQDQIRNKKHQPGSYEALVEMVKSVKKVF